MRAVLATFFVAFASWAAPQVFAPVLSHEFGEIVDGELFCWDFEIQNVGDEELLLGPIAPSCACTSAPLTKNRLLPGETITIRVCFDSTGYGGKAVLESVSIRTNDHKNPWIRLALTGYVRPAEPYQAPAKDLFASLYLLLDAREPEQYERGHFLGAVNIPYSELPTYQAFLPRGIPIFVYGGENAAKVVAALRDQGFLARALEGDLAGWITKYGPLFTTGEIAHAEEMVFDVPTISPEVLAQKFVVILDMRPLESFQEAAFPGAIHVTQGELQAMVEKIPRANELPEGVKLTVWVVDEEGKEACAVAQVLREEGLPAVALVGGLKNWRARYGSTWLIPPFWTLPAKAHNDE